MPITEKIKNRLNSKALRTLEYELSMHPTFVRNFISIFLQPNQCCSLAGFGQPSLIHLFRRSDASRESDPSLCNRLALRQFDPHRETRSQLNYVGEIREI
jgi:hypothetical protein